VQAPLPTSGLKIGLPDYARIMCAMLDIPVYDKVTESLHVLFTLYSEFKAQEQQNRAAMQ
jgi:intraflagellar transport protein 46